MSDPISIYGKFSERYNVHLMVNGHRRFFESFSISFDVENGEIRLDGRNRNGVMTECVKVNQ